MCVCVCVCARAHVLNTRVCVCARAQLLCVGGGGRCDCVSYRERETMRVCVRVWGGPQNECACVLVLGESVLCLEIYSNNRMVMLDLGFRTLWCAICTNDNDS